MADLTVPKSKYKKYLDLLIKDLPKQIYEVCIAVFSPDPATRKAGVLFILSLTGAITVTVFAVKQTIDRIREQRATHVADEDTRLKEEHAKRNEDLARLKASTLRVGTFQVPLQPEEGQKFDYRMVAAEIQIVIQCDAPDTCEYISSHKAQIADQISNSITPMTRENILSSAGKKALKKKIIERVNGILPHGRLENLYFEDVFAQ